MDGFYLAMERFPSATFAMTGRKEECVCAMERMFLDQVGVGRQFCSIQETCESGTAV